MVDAPDNLVFEHLRRLDTKLDRVTDDVSELKFRVTSVEERLARTRGYGKPGIADCGRKSAN
jgi:hypothetical protein